MHSNSTFRCRKCGIIKPLADYDLGHTGKLFQTCRTCRSSYSRRATTSWGDVANKICGGCDRDLPIEEFSWNAHTSGRSYRASRCRDCKAKKMADWLAIPGNNKRSKLNKYGITPAQYDAMFAAQGGACACCGDTEMPIDPRTGKTYDLAVDHDHTTGKVRGLLCPLCNNGLGCFKDNPVRLQLALSYLRQNR